MSKDLPARRSPGRRRAKAVATPYEPTPYERKLMETYRARRKEKPPAPRMKVSEKDGVTKLAPDHPEPSVAHIRLLEALGTRSSTSWTVFSSNCAVSAHIAAPWTRMDSTSCSPW
jgi:hypothetical protein